MNKKWKRDADEAEGTERGSTKRKRGEGGCHGRREEASGDGVRIFPPELEMNVKWASQSDKDRCTWPRKGAHGGLPWPRSCRYNDDCWGTSLDHFRILFVQVTLRNAGWFIVVKLPVLIAVASEEQWPALSQLVSQFPTERTDCGERSCSESSNQSTYLLEQMDFNTLEECAAKRTNAATAIAAAVDEAMLL